MHMTLKICLLSLLTSILFACQSTQLILENSQIQELTKCSISMIQARRNLLRRGYSIAVQGEDFFSTDFKKSDFETQFGLITGETLKEYYRRFVVFSFNKESVDYRFQYKVYRIGEPVVRLANPSFTFDRLSHYQKIRGEVCGSLEPSVKQPNEASPI